MSRNKLADAIGRLRNPGGGTTMSHGFVDALDSALEDAERSLTRLLERFGTRENATGIARRDQIHAAREAISNEMRERAEKRKK